MFNGCNKDLSEDGYSKEDGRSGVMTKLIPFGDIAVLKNIDVYDTMIRV
jgi:hypothetical protein